MLNLPQGTYNLSIDDTVWSSATWVIDRIAGAVVVAEAGAVVVAEAGAVVVAETVAETVAIAVATECNCLLVSNHMT